MTTVIPTCPTFIEGAEPPTCGSHTVKFIERGNGSLYFAPEKDITLRVQWDRRRDSISEANCWINAIDECCGLLGALEALAYEMQVFRDDILVWHGVITRIEYEFERVEVYAHDLMWIMSRRSLNPGHNYRDAPNSAGIDSVVLANDMITTRGFYRYFDEWNMQVPGNVRPVLDPGLNPITHQMVNAHQASVYQQVEHLAHYSGIDWTCWNRIIYIWDNALMWDCLVLDELNEEHISTYPRIVEYGAQAATRVVKTDGSGYSALAWANLAKRIRYGAAIDLIDSEAEPVERNEPPSQTVLANWQASADRQLSRRLPPVERVTVADNSTLLPECTWDIPTVVAGSYFDISVTRLCRTLTQTLRLDRMQVTESRETGEVINIVTNAAPLNVRGPTP